MGFGILFIGYFLILDVAYYYYTNAIAAVIMLIGLYKLSTVNRPFKYAMWAALAFTVFGCAEFGVEVYSSFAFIPAEDSLRAALSMVRYAIVLVLNIFTLLGMKEVASEVGLREIAIRSRLLTYFAVAVYSLNFLLAFPLLTSIMPAKLVLVLYVTAILSMLVFTAAVLVEIYRCYMRIYMPGADEEKEKKSRFEFVNKFRAHEEQKAREYAEYKREMQMKRLNKGKKK